MIDLVQSIRPIAAAVGRTVPSVCKNKIADLNAHALKRVINKEAKVAHS
jgi:hypothetical protein